MTCYKVKLKNGYESVLEAEDEKHLWLKIDRGQYSILPVRGNKVVKISKDNVIEINEVDGEKLKQHEYRYF